MKKWLILLFLAAFIISCNSDDDSLSSNGGGTTFPMTATIDGQSFGMGPEVGGNLSDPSGGSFGSDYHMLEGYKLYSGPGSSSRVPLIDYEYYVRLVIPKIDVSVGTHTFTSAQLPNGYFADLEISENDDPGEDEEIISGKIIVESYDAGTGRIKGTFDFKTNDGLTATETHVVSGSFNYILAD